MPCLTELGCGKLKGSLLWNTVIGPDLQSSLMLSFQVGRKKAATTSGNGLPFLKPTIGALTLCLISRSDAK